MHLQTIDDNDHRAVFISWSILTATLQQEVVNGRSSMRPPSFSSSLSLSLFVSQSVMYCSVCNGWVTRWTPQGEGTPGHTPSNSLFLSLTLIHSLSSSVSDPSVYLAPLTFSAHLSINNTKSPKTPCDKITSHLRCTTFSFPFLFCLHLHSQITLSALVCLFWREEESSLSPLGLSVSLIKDRRLMERECVALLACRPRQQHTTPAVRRDGTNRRGWGGGWKKKLN